MKVLLVYSCVLSLLSAMIGFSVSHSHSAEPEKHASLPIKPEACNAVKALAISNAFCD